MSFWPSYYNGLSPEGVHKLTSYAEVQNDVHHWQHGESLLIGGSSLGGAGYRAPNSTLHLSVTSLNLLVLPCAAHVPAVVNGCTSDPNRRLFTGPSSSLEWTCQDLDRHASPARYLESEWWPFVHSGTVFTSPDSTLSPLESRDHSDACFVPGPLYGFPIFIASPFCNSSPLTLTLGPPPP